MSRRGLLALLLLLAGPAFGQSPDEPQSLVDRATLTVQEMLTEGDAQAVEDGRTMLRRARAAVICPRVFRAGFILGGQGGSCVLVARDAAGSWSSPAFYGLASGSLGLQFGVQDMQILMLVMNDAALGALLDSQFKLGAEASLSVATIGAGIAGATTSAAGADIVAIARARGLFAGLALDGSLLTARSAWNRAYYGQEVAPRQILVSMQAYNPAADPLRAMLMRFGGAGPAAAPAPAAPAMAAPPPASDAPPPGGGQGIGPGPSPVQSSPLPPIAGRR